MSTEMSTNVAVAVAVAVPNATNEELWSLLMDVTNVKEGAVEEMAEKLFGAGLKGPSDLDILANLPKVLRSISEGLKDIPAKKFISEMRSRSVMSKQPFCPICRDAGLSAEEYTSHHIWSDETRETVICPTLLAHQCEKCGEMGHMPSYCGRIQPTKSATPKQQESVKEEEKPKHCKVCFQAGYGPEVYSTHYTKVDGEILCPTILNNVCHRCGKKGHTTKYCTVTVRSPPYPSQRPSQYTSSHSRQHQQDPRSSFEPELRSSFGHRQQQHQQPTRQQEITKKYRDERYEYDEEGRAVSMKYLPEESDPYYRRPQHFGRVQSQNLVKDAVALLMRAQLANSPEECGRLVAEAMDLQAYLLKNI